MNNKNLDSLSINDILNSLYKLEAFVEDKGYSGWDPYDFLNSNKFKSIDNKYMKLMGTQFLVYFPINLRSMLAIDKKKDPKAIGIFLRAYCKMYKANLVSREKFEAICNKLVDFLLENSSKGYSGYCWGFSFDWQDLRWLSKKGHPTIVITSLIGNAFLDLLQIIGNKKYLDIARGCCDFFLNDLNVYRFKEGICFSYTPIDDNLVVHNANLLGASFMSRVYSIMKEDILLNNAEEAMNYSISQQKENGVWTYSLYPNNKERYQIDFHQGFNLDSICDFLKYINPEDDRYKISLLKGAEFYLSKQFEDGRSLWRYPKRWPIDIHHQAQGIITFSKIFEIFPEERYIEAANRIASWTINYMQNEEGDFYFQKWPFFTNKISYMRWGQAWMMLALSEYLFQRSSSLQSTGQFYEDHN